VYKLHKALYGLKQAPRAWYCWRSLASLWSSYLVMELGTSCCKTHDCRRVCKHTDYRCSTSPGDIRVIVFIFSQVKHYGIDNRER
jgi:hypothetical protein